MGNVKNINCNEPAAKQSAKDCAMRSGRVLAWALHIDADNFDDHNESNDGKDNDDIWIKGTLTYDPTQDTCDIAKQKEDTESERQKDNQANKQ